MLVYEKDNKLNINFENSVEETPDVSIGKNGDKTEILVDGQQQSGGGGGEKFVLTATMTSATTADIDKTPSEATEAYKQGKTIVLNVPSFTPNSDYFPCSIVHFHDINADEDFFQADYIFMAGSALYKIIVWNLDPGSLRASLDIYDLGGSGGTG